MIRLFSRFDIFFSSNYMIFCFLFIINFFGFFFFRRIIYSRLNLIYNFIEEFFSSIKPKSINKIIIAILIYLIVIIFFLNITSILSFNFACTSQIGICLFLSLTIWISFLIFQNFNNLKNFLSHCIPEGTPIYLTWFLFAVELIRNLIRPITLTVRLVANILAGHLLIILLANLCFKFQFMSRLYILLNLVEFFVALIQSYIFVTIITLYYAEVN